ncbi:MAG: hypothetical protein GF309_00585 [Candidatus Lokiarchaeota archaeon]|nr:hypothetical protein [Candidatus Lokiarchaeota archaeon]
MPKKQTTKIAEILIALGGLVGLLYGILEVLNMGLAVFSPLGGVLGSLITGIIAIVISLVVLATSGVVDIPSLKMEKNVVVIIVLGVLLFLFAADLAGALVIIGAILMLL